MKKYQIYNNFIFVLYRLMSEFGRVCKTYFRVNMGMITVIRCLKYVNVG